jgi:hypothetical protein
MKIERQFESKNYVVKISVESKNVHGHSTLTNHAEPTRRTLTEAARMYGEIHEDLFTQQWGGEKRDEAKGKNLTGATEAEA